MFDKRKKEINTLHFNENLCINCGMCTSVCPHGVFETNDKKTILAIRNACMECGACQLNCPVGAITVDSGVGCATAMMKAALLRKKEVSCEC